MNRVANLPSSIRVGYRDISIAFVDQQTLGGACRGDYLDGWARIRIQDDMLSFDQAETLIHETLHSILSTTSLPDPVEERIVTILSFGLAQVFADNKEVISWLQNQLSRKK